MPPSTHRQKTQQKNDNDGIVIRFNSQENIGQAAALRFDRHEDEFRKFIGEQKLELDWKNQPWLHVWYNRFFLSHRDEPEYFVSVVKTKDLESKEEFEALVNPETDPLQIILEEDSSPKMSSALQRGQGLRSCSRKRAKFL